MVRLLEGVSVFDVDPMDGGLSVRGWLQLWDACHTAGYAGPQLVAWPDGRPLIDQPRLTVEMFALVGEAMALFEKTRRAVGGIGK